MKKKLEKLLKTKLSREILNFFYTNQQSVDTLSGVSAWVREDKGRVKEILDSFVALGILVEDSGGSIKGYSYTRDEDIMKIIEGLIEENV